MSALVRQYGSTVLVDGALVRGGANAGLALHVSRLLEVSIRPVLILVDGIPCF